MDDLFSSLENFINSPDGKKQLDDLSKMFNTNETSTNDTNSSDNNENNKGFDFSGIDINMIMMIGQIMDGLNSEDENTKLLKALKPHLKEEKHEKIEKAIKILKMLSILPLLKDSGILGGLFSDDSKQQ